MTPGVLLRVSRHGVTPFAMIAPHRRKARGSQVPVHPFDLAYGTETGALIPGEHLATGHRHDRFITAYHGTAPSLFRKLMKRWRTLATAPLERTAFVDIGAGKGRAMLLAAEMPFRRIVGVELHPQLAAVARRNLAVWGQKPRAQHRPSGSPRNSARQGNGLSEAISWGNRTLAHSAFQAPIRLMEADVMQLRLPVGPCCFFLYNPFGVVLMDRFLTRLDTLFGDRGELDLLYVNDEERDLIVNEHPGFAELWRGRIHLSREDRDADKATIAHCADGVYVTTGYEDCSIYRLQR